jgi:pre-mRNA-splicing factor CWC22
LLSFILNSFSLLRIVNYQVGSRYWGGEEEKRNAPKRDAKYNEEESYSYKKDAKSEENKHDDQREHQPTTSKEKDPILMRTGGAYIPPAKLRLMQAKITDKTSLAFQRLAWESLKKSIHGLINKVNVSNIPLITTSLMKENIVRGRGLLSRSIVQAQAASPTFTHVYAALVALINSKVMKKITVISKFAYTF